MTTMLRAEWVDLSKYSGSFVVRDKDGREILATSKKIDGTRNVYNGRGKLVEEHAHFPAYVVSEGDTVSMKSEGRPRRYHQVAEIRIPVD